MNFPHPLMAPVVELALQAGDAILPFWRTGTAVTAKADDSPVTAADLAAHHLILAGLTALDPSIPVLSEEDANIPQSVRAGWQRWWLVDPLDGTKEFISRQRRVHRQHRADRAGAGGVWRGVDADQRALLCRWCRAWARGVAIKVARPCRSRCVMCRRRARRSPWSPAVAIPAPSRSACWPG